MRLYYLSASVIPALTANSVQVMKMCEAFAELGNEVVLFAEKGGDCNPFGYYGVAAIFELVACPAGGRSFVARRSLVRCFQNAMRSRAAPDFYYGRNAFALLTAAHSCVPLVYEAHLLPGGVQAQIESRLFRKPGFLRLVTVSDVLAGDYRDKYPDIHSDRIITASSGASPPSSRKTQVPVLDLSCGRIKVGYVGSLSAGRGIPHLAALAKRLPEVDFHVVGGSREEVDRWLAILLPPRNFQFHGSLPPNAIADVLTQFDILVAPYETRVFTSGGLETGRWASPMKLIEYMSSGKPIVASDLLAIREVVSDEVHALLAKPESLSSWENQLRRLVTNERLRTQLGANAQHRLLEKFTWRQRADRILREIRAGLDAACIREYSQPLV